MPRHNGQHSIAHGRSHTLPPRGHACLGVINAVLAFWAQYHCRHARNPHPDPA